MILLGTHAHVARRRQVGTGLLGGGGGSGGGNDKEKEKQREFELQRGLAIDTLLHDYPYVNLWFLGLWILVIVLCFWFLGRERGHVLCVLCVCVSTHATDVGCNTCVMNVHITSMYVCVCMCVCIIHTHQCMHTYMSTFYRCRCICTFL